MAGDTHRTTTVPGGVSVRDLIELRHLQATLLAGEAGLVSAFLVRQLRTPRSHSSRFSKSSHAMTHRFGLAVLRRLSTSASW